MLKKFIKDFDICMKSNFDSEDHMITFEELGNLFYSFGFLKHIEPKEEKKKEVVPEVKKPSPPKKKKPKVNMDVKKTAKVESLSTEGKVDESVKTEVNAEVNAEVKVEGTADTTEVVKPEETTVVKPEETTEVKVEEVKSDEVKTETTLVKLEEVKTETETTEVKTESTEGAKVGNIVKSKDAVKSKSNVKVVKKDIKPDMKTDIKSKPKVGTKDNKDLEKQVPKKDVRPKTSHQLKDNKDNKDNKDIKPATKKLEVKDPKKVKSTSNKLLDNQSPTDKPAEKSNKKMVNVKIFKKKEPKEPKEPPDADLIKNAWNILSENNKDVDKIDPKHLLVFCASVLGLYNGGGDEEKTEDQTKRDEDKKDEKVDDKKDEKVEEKVETKVEEKKVEDKVEDKLDNKVEDKVEIKDEDKKEKPEEKKDGEDINKDSKTTSDKKVTDKKKVMSKQSPPAQKDKTKTKNIISKTSPREESDKKDNKKDDIKDDKETKRDTFREKDWKKNFNTNTNQSSLVVQAAVIKEDKKPILKIAAPELDLTKYQLPPKVAKQINMSFHQLYINRMNFVLEAKQKSKLIQIEKIKEEQQAKVVVEKPVSLTKHSKDSAEQWRKKCFEAIRNEFALEDDKEINFETMMGYLAKQKEKY